MTYYPLISSSLRPPHFPVFSPFACLHFLFLTFVCRFTSELASAYAASGDSSIIPKGLTPCAQYPVSALTSALADPAFTSFCNSIARLVAAGVFARPPALPGVGVEEKEPKPLLVMPCLPTTPLLCFLCYVSRLLRDPSVSLNVPRVLVHSPGHLILFVPLLCPL